jgi:hypothetical protein
MSTWSPGSPSASRTIAGAMTGGRALWRSTARPSPRCPPRSTNPVHRHGPCPHIGKITELTTAVALTEAVRKDHPGNAALGDPLRSSGIINSRIARHSPTGRHASPARMCRAKARS